MTENIVRRIDIQVKSDGVRAVATELDKLVGAEGALVRETEKTIKVMERQEAKLERNARAMDKIYDLERKIAQVERMRSLAESSGLGGLESYSRVTAGLQRLRKEYEQLAGAQEKVSKGAKLNRADWANLSAQVQDVVVMLGSGASPITTGIQQGPQIFDVFSRKGPEERVAALKEFGLGIMRFAVHPITLFVAAAGTAAVAVYKWQQQNEALIRSLNGLGRSSGLTLSGANQIAGAAASATGISTGSARGMASQFLGAGVSGSNLGGAIGLAKPLERSLGITSESLAGALGNPARGAEELAQKYGLLSYAQERRVRELAAEGKQVEATAELIKALTESVSKLHDPTSKLFDAFERGAAKIASAFSWLGERIANIPGSPFASVSSPQSQSEAERARIAGLMNNALRRQEGLDRISQDAALSAREITAQTYAQREAATMERERVQVLRDTLDVTRATLSAEAERVKLLAQAQRVLDDYVRTGQQERSLLGKTPFQRGLQEIENRFRDVGRQLPMGGAGVTPSARSDATRRTEALLAEATRRGLEPSDANFDMLMREGVGSGGFKGRLLSGASAMSSTINMPSDPSAGISSAALRERNAQRSAFITESQAAPLREFNKELAAQERLLAANESAFAGSTEQVARAVKEQELLNQYVAAGVPITDAMRQQIEQSAAGYGRLTAAQERFADATQRLNQIMDELRTTASSALSGFVSNLRSGQNAGEALMSVLDRIAQKAIDIASTSLVEGLFGATGKKGGGIFGDSIFSSIGGLFGLGGKGSGSGYFSSSLFSGSPFSFGFANGGIMTSMGPVPLRRYAGGGIADSPQMAMFGEGSRPEAYVPLPDGRRIPVAMDNQGGQNVTVHNYAAGVEVTPQMTPQGVMLIVKSAIDANNRSLPSVLADRNRRR